MKTYSWLVLAMALCSPCLNAQLSLPLGTTAPVAVEVGPHHRVWQKVSADEHGQTITNSYTELETGMNFLDPATGRYEESQASFEISPKGYAVARKGQHQVTLAPNINSGGSVDLLADGKRFLSNPMALSFFDTATGTNVLVAEVKDCIGQFIPPNVILYDDAFTDIKGAIRYTYTKAGFEQDVLIYDSTGLGSPDDYGLNASTTLLEMYSEFHEPPTPQKTTELTLEGFPDETLNFGLMAIGQGTAFDLDMAEQSIHVAKSWLSISGRTFLVESVPFTAARPSLDKLRASVSNAKAMKVAQRTVPDRRRLVALASMRPKTTSKEVASIQPGRMSQEKGFLIDYSTLNTGQTNYLFRGDFTYFISGVVYLSGKTVFEGGAVIKYDSSTTPGLWVQGSVDCQATGYRPLVMTGKDDNTAGEIISGSTGLPTAAGYANYGIVIDNTTSTNTSWSNLRFAYLRSAFYVNRQATHTLSHAQIVNCGKAILVYASSDVRVRNVLVDQAVTAFDQGSGTARGENLTIHRTTNLKLEPNGPVPLYVTNSLIVGVTNVPATTNSFLSTSSYVFTNDVPAIFQTVGAGSHYLSDNTYRNSGTTNSSLAAELKKLTTYPPIVLTNDFTVSTTLTPQAQRDTDIPDLHSRT